jgi:hypothetical protein
MRRHGADVLRETVVEASARSRAAAARWASEKCASCARAWTPVSVRLAPASATGPPSKSARPSSTTCCTATHSPALPAREAGADVGDGHDARCAAAWLRASVYGDPPGNAIESALWRCRNSPDAPGEHPPAHAGDAPLLKRWREEGVGSGSTSRSATPRFRSCAPTSPPTTQRPAPRPRSEVPVDRAGQRRAGRLDHAVVANWEHGLAELRLHPLRRLPPPRPHARRPRPGPRRKSSSPHPSNASKARARSRIVPRGGGAREAGVQGKRDC